MEVSRVLSRGQPAEAASGRSPASPAVRAPIAAGRTSGGEAARGGRGGFTLVELLVVIAIIGVLVALLLPAVQAAREASRRTQCANQLRQMALAALNLHGAHRLFPTGGVYPWPNIEQYSSGGKPFGPDKQGLSWAFQILPFLEQNAVHGLSTTEQLTRTPIGLYFCPSRRPPTQNPTNGAWLLDYAAVNPVPARGETGAATFDANLPTNAWCRDGFGIWGARDYGDNQIDLFTPEQLGANYVEFRGVIVRASHYLERGAAAARARDLGYPKVSERHVLDGLSQTLLLAEKRIHAAKYADHKPDDDRGWSDGWDIDVIRSGGCQPRPDSSEDTGVNGGFASVLTVGAAHPSGFNAAYADASVRNLSYDIAAEAFNQLSHRSDGEISADDR